jgi:hypothetical protein
MTVEKGSSSGCSLNVRIVFMAGKLSKPVSLMKRVPVSDRGAGEVKIRCSV